MSRPILNFVVVVLTLTGTWAAVSVLSPWDHNLHVIGTAVADDGDDGDDGGGAGAHGGAGPSGGGGKDYKYRPRGDGLPAIRNLFNRVIRGFPQAPRRPSRNAAPAAPLPVSAPDEIVAIGTADDLVAAETLGFEIIADEDAGLVGGRLARLRIPSGLTLAEALQLLIDARPAVVADLNHFYRPEMATGCAGLHCAALSLIGWPAGDRFSASTPRIGLVDTGINVDHGALRDRKIVLTELSDAARDASSKIHGTAVAALLVGSPESRSPGLLPNAELIAVDAFHRQGQDDRADVFDLVRGLSIVAAEDVDVVNLSLTGPDNAVLERAVAAVAARDIMMVAAAGNDGPHADPLYPAAYPNVTVATAIDRSMRPYRHAGRGEHIDFAAPGVEVWTAASIEGARTKTGTSFAAPFVTAAIAFLRAELPDIRRDDVKQLLAAAAEDLGDPGRDPVFGWGLLRVDRIEFVANAEP